MAAAPEVCPWQRHWDDTGTVFYYNENTEESEWDVPPGWEAHFAGLDEKASGGADGGANGGANDDAGGRDGSAGKAYEAEDVGGADQRQVDDAEGAQALLGLSQASSGDQGEEAFVAVSPPDSPAEKEEKREGEEGSRAGSSTEDSDNDSEQEYYPQSPAEPVEKVEEGRLNLSPVVADASAAGGYDGTPSPHYSPEDEEEEEEARSSSPRSPSPSRADGSSTAASRTRGSSKDQRSHSNQPSPSPELGLSFPAFGDDYSPNHDAEWQVNEEEELEGGKNSASPNESEASAVGGLSPVVESAGGAAAGGGGQKQGLRKAGGKGKENSVEDGKPQYSEEEMAKMVKSAESKIADCERRLEERDAIMEVDFTARVAAYQSARERLQHLKGEAPNRQAFLKETRNASVKKLIAGYNGYAQQASMVNDWIRVATKGDIDTESLMLQQLKKLIKTNFDAKKVDTLLDSSMPAWLTAMQDDTGWRRTLIELAREHRASALLRFVLKQLSDMGYHREIASVISETDLFSVFNGVLKDALARIPADDEVQATEALADLKRMCCSTSYMFMYSQQLLINLERAAEEESRQEAAAAETANRFNGSGSGSRKRGREETSPSSTATGVSTRKEADGRDGGETGRNSAARKYKRLRQELAKHMYAVGGRADNNSSSPDGGRGMGAFSLSRSISGGAGIGGGGSSRNGFGRGAGGGGGADEDGAASAGAPTGGFLRGVEMALSLELPRPSAGAAAAVAVAAEKSARAAADAVVSLLGQAGGGGARRAGVLLDAVDGLVSAFGLKPAVRVAVIGAAAVAVELQAAESEQPKRRPPAYLVRHPTLMDILLEALFHPAHRCPSEDLRAGCCAILAYASCVEVPPLDTNNDGSSSNGGSLGGEAIEVIDLVELAETSHALLQAAGECFETSQLASLQGRLRPFAEHPLVSLGVLKWVHAQASTESFVSTPSFLSYAPVFLKLCGQAADEHPPQRPEAFEILKLMLNARTAPDTPPAAKAKLKQHILLRMAELVVKGYMLPVFEYLRKLAAGPGLDPALIGFFMVKIVGVAIPRPVARGGNANSYSPAFLNAMAGLMGVPRVRQALIALRPVDRERFAGYARYCLKFQRDDLTPEALEWMKQLQIGLERA
ncbi:conserved unknown protein [Ectocarpus siliculosus]|uniref:WW domain-containing protein n=1 Tax=Ectocarpus siliculosus TaxID=2880 RepID=D8LQE4_ECTSI|nr:conserved unknown protein [Ectocarpus siliculosus]|eukprot:CBN78708.1 conserved unknown protein [Ectocarpus siliculosus]